jgi:hypothetical protein
MDQSTKKQRETSLSVVGLEPDGDEPDSELFPNLCRDELDLQPDVVRTMRLGGKHNPPAGKPKPFLVILHDVGQVLDILASARLLRRSANPAGQVYINPNLTKAEAEAAYQLRKKRRQATQHRVTRSASRQLYISSFSTMQHQLLVDLLTQRPGLQTRSFPLYQPIDIEPAGWFTCRR